MILTVTLDPALDVTYDVPGAVWGDVNRVAAVRTSTSGGSGSRTTVTIPCALLIE